MASTQQDDKTSWPELVGKTATEAKAMIEQETNHKVTVHIVPQNSMVTMDYRLDRVRIFEEADHTVASPPMIG